MKIKYLLIALFSLGLVSTSCGKKKKGEHKEQTEQKAEGAAHDDHGHDHGDHSHDH